MMRRLQYLAGLLKEENDFDLSDNPLDVEKVNLGPNQTLLINWDEHEFKPTIINGTPEQNASKFFDKAIKKELDYLKNTIINDPDNLISYYGGSDFQILKKHEDGYLVTVGDRDDYYGHDSKVFLGSKSPSFEDIQPVLVRLGNKIEVDYNNPNYDLQEDGIVYLFYDNGEFEEVKELPEDYFEEYVLELQDQMKDEKRRSPLKEEDDDFDLSYNPFDMFTLQKGESLMIDMDCCRAFTPQEVEIFKIDAKKAAIQFWKSRVQEELDAIKDSINQDGYNPDYSYGNSEDFFMVYELDKDTYWVTYGEEAGSFILGSESPVIDDIREFLVRDKDNVEIRDDSDEIDDVLFSLVEFSLDQIKELPEGYFDKEAAKYAEKQEKKREKIQKLADMLKNQKD